jgi:uncharacterized RDD family membrane protein YckC
MSQPGGWQQPPTPPQGGWQQPPMQPQGGWQQPPMPPQGGWVQNTQAGPAPGIVYAGFWIRLVAYIIDAIILGVVQAVLAGTLGQTTGQSISGLVGIVYFIGMWGYMGQTVGMMPFNMRIVRNTDGGKITWVNAILRFIGMIISFVVIFIGVIWVAFDSRKRGWHDMIGGTVVVRPVG